MSAPVAIANAVADALGIERPRAAADAAARLGAAAAVKPAPFLYERPDDASRRRSRCCRARRRGEGARRRPVARADAQLPAPPAVGARRRQPHRRLATARRRARSARPCASAASPGTGSSTSRCPTSATTSRATAAPSAARSPTPTRARSCRSVSSCSAAQVQTRSGPAAPGRGVLRLALHDCARARRAARRLDVAGTATTSASRSSRSGTATSRSRCARARCVSRAARFARRGSASVRSSSGRPLLELDLDGAPATPRRRARPGERAAHSSIRRDTCTRRRRTSST